ncbi:lipase family protein [Bowmanella denitrificans]|uniref:lipase family protein n=1 Tax=Bowmanella denitrificans TaxID=366582 RepID=UPI000C9BD88D|nr:lipase family protein [Bowmanella denitrificans]
MTPLNPTSSSNISQNIYQFSELVEASPNSRYLNPTNNNFFKGLPLKDRKAAKIGFEKYGFTPIDIFRARTGIFSGESSCFGCIASGMSNSLEENRLGESLIAIKGTSSRADIATDLKTLPTNFNGHMTHRGFVQTFRSFEHHIDRYLDWHSPSKIHLVGHSLGGALATLTAYHIAKRDSSGKCQIKLYTFGAPRVGFTSFNQEVDKLIGKQNIYRVYHDADVVSMVPMFPFLHVHSSDFFDGYRLNWINGLVSVPAHYMNNYIATIRNADWGNIKGSISERKVMNWLDGLIHAGVGFVMFSAPLLSMITLGLHLILKHIHKLGVSSQLPSYTTPLDTLAWLLYKGAAAALEMSRWVRNLLKGILAFLGEPMIGGQSLTVIFIRYLLGRLASTIMRMATQALQASQAQWQMPIFKAQPNWQKDQAQALRKGASPRQNGYRIPGPNNRLGGPRRGPLAI